MQHHKRINATQSRLQSEDTAAILSPPPSARRTGLELSRAALLRLLAREPTVCRSVGLLR
jgi:hypothetical protein